jgi:hypothetical protein
VPDVIISCLLLNNFSFSFMIICYCLAFDRCCNSLHIAKVIPFCWSEMGALGLRFFWFQWYSLENMFQIGFFWYGFQIWVLPSENVYL